MNGIDENNLPGLQDPLATKEGHQKVELFISCRGLKNKDLISLSDPQVKIYITKNNEEILLGETECIKDNLNPNFVKSFLLDYVFEIKQTLHFKIIDVDDSNGNFDPLGDVYTSLGEIMGARNQVLIADIIESNKKGGKLILRTEIVDGMQSHATFEISGKKLTNNAGFFSKSNPFFRFSRVHEELTNITVFESEVIKKNLNPNWKPFDISFKTLCNNDAVRPILCSVYHKKPRQDKLMGQCTFSVDDIQSLNVKEFQLKKPKTKTKTYGILEIRNFTVAERPSFLEYIRRGIQLNVVAAIDFTSSNGNPKSVASLHAIRNDDQLNDYQKALHGVCDILLCYDYDKKVPVYGFGGKPFESSQVSHCFSLTGNEEDPSAHGLDGIMELYKNSLAHIRLSSPTFFKHILRKGMDIAVKAKSEGSSVYTILMIITDGLIHDMQQTIDMLVDCAELPLSIIIVGVGNEDFSMMETLDADHGPPLCNSRGERMKRDLVQFVAFNKFKGDKAALAEEVLAEVPRQLIDYMKSQGISPKRPDKLDVNNLVFARGESKNENELIKPSDINLQSLKKPVSNVDLDNKQEGGRAI